MNVHIAKDGMQIGPYSLEELNARLASEVISGDDLCWYEGREDWIPVSQLPGFVPPHSKQEPPPVPTAQPQKEAQELNSTAPSNGQWYYSERDQKIGPHALDEVIRLIRANLLQRDVLVWHGGMKEWAPAYQTELSKYFDEAANRSANDSFPLSWAMPLLTNKSSKQPPQHEKERKPSSSGAFPISKFKPFLRIGVILCIGYFAIKAALKRVEYWRKDMDASNQLINEHWLRMGKNQQEPTPQVKSPTPNISERTEPPKPLQPQPPAPQSLDQEAVAFAKNKFFELWTQVGDSWFTWHTLPETGGNFKEKFFYFIQIRGLTYKVKPNRLSEADTLNGFQWRGEVGFFKRVRRIYDRDNRDIDGPQVPQWSDWDDNDGVETPIHDFSYFIIKKNGQWTNALWPTGQPQTFGGTAIYTKPSEEQIKKILTESQDPNAGIASNSQLKNIPPPPVPKSGYLPPTGENSGKETGLDKSIDPSNQPTMPSAKSTSATTNLAGKNAKASYVVRPIASYPPESRTAGEQGVVILRLTVDGNGRPTAVSIAKSSGFPRLDRAAVEAGWRCRVRDAAAGSHLDAPVRFNLSDR